MTEEWRPVVGFEDRYEVSNLGRVRSLRRRVRQVGPQGEFERSIGGRLMKLHLDKGYPRLSLRDGTGKCFLRNAYRLVAEAFLGPPPFKGAQVAHKDGVRTNSRLDNLRWATAKENAADMVAHGTAPVGENNPRSLLTEDQVLEIRARYVKRYGENRRLGKEYGVSGTVIGHIIARRTYRHI